MNMVSYRMIWFILSCVLILNNSFAQDPKPIQLPAPQMNGGKPLMQSLKERKSLRTYSDEKLSFQMLSNLLWATCGINRPESKRRTAPSARNLQEIDVYVAMEEGLFLYNAQSNILKPILAEDIRALTGTQSFVAHAPINLVFVADFAKTPDASEEDKVAYPAMDTGYMSQNVYLFCASEGLATVARGMVDRDALAKKMGLRSNQKIMLAQSVGYPIK
jgi:SagB-type dehydrogenase family enzyme